MVRSHWIPTLVRVAFVARYIQPAASGGCIYASRSPKHIAVTRSARRVMKPCISAVAGSDVTDGRVVPIEERACPVALAMGGPPVLDPNVVGGRCARPRALAIPAATTLDAVRHQVSS